MRAGRVLVGPPLVLGVLGACHPQPPLSQLPLHRVTLYQNGIGYFERSGHVGGDRVELEFSRHEVDDVLKTLTVLDQQAAGVATVDVPPIGEKDTRVRVGVKLSGKRAHDVAVDYAVPTPTWKAAYRIVIGDATSLLQGWAVIDNASQEDWTHVALTLATGAPMSYALDLHSPEYVSRPDATGKLVAPVVTGVVEGEKVGASAGKDGGKEVDSDHDGIPDSKDQCPQDAETYNGYDDDDGCPDRGRVVVSDSAIEVLDQVYFAGKSDHVKPESAPILEAVAATLKGNPTIQLIEIQGHAADNEGDALALSDRRAEAVRDWLIVHGGVAPSRLQSQGYGSTQPQDPAKTDDARAKNRRVAFLILKRTDDEQPKKPAPYQPPVETGNTQASAQANVKPVEVAGAVRYELAEPVTLRRGASTMVSILDKPVTAEDAYLWRPDDHAPGSDRHPFRAVRFANTSGFTLQPGSVAIFARGTFVGDSLLGRLDLDETTWIPYALDSGTTVTPELHAAERPMRIVAIHKGVMTVENADVRVSRYVVAAGRQPAKRIFLRHAKAFGHVPTALPAETVDQGDAYLLPLALEPGKTAEITLEEREPKRRTLELLDASAGDVATYVEGSHLDPAIGAKVRAAVELRKQMADLEEQLAAARSRGDDVAQRGAEIRESLRALEKVRDADALRKKLVASLAETTAQNDALAKEITTKTEALAAARAKVQDAVRDLVIEEAK